MDEERSTCLRRLLKLLDARNHSSLFFKYVHDLATLHDRTGRDKAEAAFALCLHADQLPYVVAARLGAVRSDAGFGTDGRAMATSVARLGGGAQVDRRAPARAQAALPRADRV